MAHITREELSKFSMKGQLHIDELPSAIILGKPYQISGDNGSYVLLPDKSSISIRKPGDMSVNLRAEINPNKQLEWRLYTRNHINEKPKHDLYAGLFYDAALSYLLSMGNNIDVMYEMWNGGTINHTMYRASMKKSPNYDLALRSTYSWKKASEHGFNRYKALSGTGLDVLTYIFLFLR